MAAKDKDARIQRERARAYQARQQLNAGRARRRVRDNVLGGVVGAVLLIAVVGLQVAYYAAGPGRPAPEPTPSSTVETPTPGSTDPVSPAPSETP